MARSPAWMDSPRLAWWGALPALAALWYLTGGWGVAALLLLLAGLAVLILWYRVFLFVFRRILPGPW
jgi:hypothetical protein